MYNRYLSVYKKHYPVKKLAPVLALIIALSPFAIDMYLPAIPTMAAFFSVDIHLIELSIPLYIIGVVLPCCITAHVCTDFFCTLIRFLSVQLKKLKNETFN